MAARPRSVGDGTYDGVLLVHKPTGPTSHDVVALVRRLSSVRRVGHGGTLDPFASGVLPVFIGQATRLVEYHLGDEKGYRALVGFGARSTTDDLDGELTRGESAPPLDAEAVRAALDAFRGEIEQIPPSHSAVHVSGRRAYELARGGEQVSLEPRRVTIHRLDLLEWDAADPQRPTAVLEVRCSAGTYIRAIARDLGERLGCGAYLAGLVRTASGPFRLEDAHDLDAVRAAFSGPGRPSILLDPDAGLDALPRVSLVGHDLAWLTKGQPVRMREGVEGVSAGRLRVADEAGRLVAIARLESGRLHPEKVLAAGD